MYKAAVIISKNKIEKYPEPTSYKNNETKRNKGLINVSRKWGNIK